MIIVRDNDVVVVAASNASPLGIDGTTVMTVAVVFVGNAGADAIVIVYQHDRTIANTVCSVKR